MIIVEPLFWLCLFLYTSGAALTISVIGHASDWGETALDEVWWLLVLQVLFWPIMVFIMWSLYILAECDD